MQKAMLGGAEESLVLVEGISVILIRGSSLLKIKVCVLRGLIT